MKVAAPITESKPKAHFLSTEQLEVIHNSSLKVLENTGIRVLSQQSLDILKKAGARVDYDRNHATIPRDLVEEALKRAPKTIPYCARNPKNDLMLNKTETHFTTGGSPACITDWETGERRASTNDDLARWTRVADYLDNVHLVWGSLVPIDVPAPMQGLTAFVSVLRNTEKHVEGEALDARNARYQIEIAATIIGGVEQLKKRSIISAIQCPISPLTYDKGITEGAIDASNAMSPELLVIDNEIIAAIRRLARGFEVNDDTLALDIINKVGPGGIFLVATTQRQRHL